MYAVRGIWISLADFVILPVERSSAGSVLDRRCDFLGDVRNGKR